MRVKKRYSEKERNYKTSSTNAESQADMGDPDSTPTTPSDNTPSASSTWNNWPNPPAGGTASKTDPSRPHTISSAYEKAHGRPALKPDMFEPPAAGGGVVEMRPKPARTNSSSSSSSLGSNSSSNRPSATISKMQPVLPPHCPKPKMKVVAPPMLPPGAQQPIYANTALMNQVWLDDGEPTTPTTPAGMSQVEMVYSLLSMLGTHDKDDMFRTLFAMSQSQDSCIAMRQSDKTRSASRPTQRWDYTTPKRKANRV